MSLILRDRPKSLTLTYIGVFAALNALADLVPFTPILGVPGASFRFGWVASCLTGVLLGPSTGVVSCLIGGSISLLTGQAQIFGPFSLLRPAISALISGMLISERWKAPAAILLLLVSVWLSMPVGRDAAAILVFHITGLAIMLSLRKIPAKLARSRQIRDNLWGLFLISYCANISRHLFGNIILAALYHLEPVYFVAAAPITLIEQLTFAMGTTILAAPLNRLPLGLLQQE